MYGQCHCYCPQTTKSVYFPEAAVQSIPTRAGQTLLAQLTTKMEFVDLVYHQMRRWFRFVSRVLCTKSADKNGGLCLLTLHRDCA